MYVFHAYYILLYHAAAALVNLLRSSLIHMVEYLEQPSGLIFWRDPVFAKLAILNATTTAFTFSVLHHRRLISAALTCFLMCAN